MDERQTALAIRIVTLIAAAYLSSGIIVDLVSSHIPVFIDSAASRAERVSSVGKMAGIDYYASVWEKNVFNPGGVTGVAKPALKEMDLETETVEEINIPLSALNYILIGTVSGQASHAFAIIKIPAEEEQMLYRTGDMVGPAEIVRIERNRVILNNSGRQEMLEVAFDTASLEVTGKKRRGDSASKGIRKVSANRFILDRKEVDRLSGDMSQFMTQVRIVPNIVRGKASGYKLMNVKKGSLVEGVGLQDGDIVKEINGKPIDKPEAAFGAYRQLKDEGRFVIEIERKGKRETLSYDIR
ncbi:MAG: type II secretion system protein GspC [bacterium]|nr:type II secretion system protein GspC [bacterium]